jgi:hypothetical protein
LSETIEALENIDSVLESYERQMETNKAKREELKEALKAIPE